MAIYYHREGAENLLGISGHGVWEYHLPKRQGHARTRLSARVARNYVQGLHRLDDRREPSPSTGGSPLGCVFLGHYERRTRSMGNGKTTEHLCDHPIIHARWHESAQANT